MNILNCKYLSFTSHNIESCGADSLSILIVGKASVGVSFLWFCRDDLKKHNSHSYIASLVLNSFLTEYF